MILLAPVERILALETIFSGPQSPRDDRWRLGLTASGTALHAPVDADNAVVPPSLDHLTIDARWSHEAHDHAEVVLEAIPISGNPTIRPRTRTSLRTAVVFRYERRPRRLPVHKRDETSMIANSQRGTTNLFELWRRDRRAFEAVAGLLQTNPLLPEHENVSPHRILALIDREARFQRKEEWRLS